VIRALLRFLSGDTFRHQAKRAGELTQQQILDDGRAIQARRERNARQHQERLALYRRAWDLKEIAARRTEESPESRTRLMFPQVPGHRASEERVH
jgi:hypothetical protein